MKMRFLTLLIVLLAPGLGVGAEVQLAVPLQDGRFSIVDLRNVLRSDLQVPKAIVEQLPDLDFSIDVGGVGGWMMVRALNEALGNGFHLAVDDNTLRISVDTAKLPAGWDQSCEALDRFTRIAAPDATARQARRFGLHLPITIDSKKPMVVLVHGLDGDGDSCRDLAGLLGQEGFQTATFVYPSERPLDENAALLARHMLALREDFPELRIDLVTESMGGLIARKYVEGADYAGGVDRFILIAPPNEGSAWIGSGWILKLIVNAGSWMHDSGWSPSWMVTEGICQESGDLRPESDFLSALNAQPRRSGVRYTVIAGDRPAVYRYEAGLLAIPIAVLDGSISRVWGFRQMEGAMRSERQSLLKRTGESDGPVALDSAKLAGVADFVALHADHIALFKSIDGNPPAAWPVIQNRLAN